MPYLDHLRKRLGSQAYSPKYFRRLLRRYLSAEASAQRRERERADVLARWQRRQQMRQWAADLPLRARPTLIAQMLRDITAALDSVQGRCRERCIAAHEVVYLIGRVVRTGAPAHTEPVRLPQAYRYRYTWTGARAWLHGDRICWTVARVSSQEQLMSAPPCGEVHPALGLCPPLWEGTLSSDAFSWPLRRGRRIRYDADGIPVGIAIPMPADLQRRFGRWEHGRDEAECLAEISRKRDILAQERMDARAQRRLDRAERLVLRLAPEARITYEDARAVGACDAGIRGWAARHGIADLTQAVPLRLVTQSEPLWALRIARHLWLRHRAA